MQSQPLVGRCPCGCAPVCSVVRASAASSRHHENLRSITSRLQGTAEQAVRDWLVQPGAQFYLLLWWGRPPPEHPGEPLALLASGAAGAPPAAASFRYWIDEVLWSRGAVAVELVDGALRALGGERTGGGSAQQLGWRRGDERARPQHLGPAHVSSWDVLWTKSTYGLTAARRLPPTGGRAVSAIAGLNCLTMKKRLVQTLKAAYGPEGAAAITPLSFALPEEVEQWEAWIKGKANREEGLSSAGRRGQQPTGGAGSEASPARGGSSSSSRGGGGGNASTSASSDRGDRGGAGLWMLKTGQDAGKGLLLLPARDAVAAARARCASTSARDADDGPLEEHEDGGAGATAFYSGSSSSGSSSSSKRDLKVAQRYVSDPLLLPSAGGGVGGRKFHLRLWLLVTRHRPLLAYLHRDGLVLFASQPYSRHPAEEEEEEEEESSAAARNQRGATPSRSSDPAAAATAGGRPPPGHVTNYARNADGEVWPLGRLADELGPGPWALLWRRMERAAALALAAALGSLHAAHAWLAPPVDAYGFQMIGADFLVDSDLKPWLLELNSSPSTMAVHSSPAVRDVIARIKSGMLCDVFAMVQPRLGGSGGGGGKRSAGAGDSGPATQRRPADAQQQRQHSSKSGSSGSSSSSSSSATPSFDPNNWRAQARLEQQRQGGFLPLTHHFRSIMAGEFLAPETSSAGGDCGGAGGSRLAASGSSTSSSSGRRGAAVGRGGRASGSVFSTAIHNIPWQPEDRELAGLMV